MAIKVVGFKALMLKQAKRWREEAAERLRVGYGVDNRKLAAKVVPNGKPLGFDKSSGGIVAALLRSPIRIARDGYTILTVTRKKDNIFHRGSRRQVARPIAGFDNEFLDFSAQEILNAIGKAGKKGGLFK